MAAESQRVPAIGAISSKHWKFECFFFQPLELFAARLELLVAVEHEELRGAIGEGVVVFGIGQRHEIVVPMGILLMVSKDREQRDPTD